ncbi:exported hypothetical protein [uncultured Microbacterium sp.]|uniref:Uncharacterized protein n=1 Tax=uncultured Microbacterium sp. TaxID=191216 RepID=A0A1Y5P7Y7_9MICO|nr:exported hypothetical protein [uncultured Microbacterium sp.]
MARRTSSPTSARSRATATVRSTRLLASSTTSSAARRARRLRVSASCDRKRRRGGLRACPAVGMCGHLTVRPHMPVYVPRMPLRESIRA